MSPVGSEGSSENVALRAPPALVETAQIGWHGGAGYVGVEPDLAERKQGRKSLARMVDSQSRLAALRRNHRYGPSGSVEN